MRKGHAMTDSTDKIIVSKAHDWVQAPPLSENVLICRRCGIRTAIGQFDVARCRPHYELARSGWPDEGRHDKVLSEIEADIERAIKHLERCPTTTQFLMIVALAPLAALLLYWGAVELLFWLRAR